MDLPILLSTVELTSVNSGERPLYSVARTETVPNSPSSGKKLESCGTTSPILQVGVVDAVAMC